MKILWGNKITLYLFIAAVCVSMAGCKAGSCKNEQAGQKGEDLFKISMAGYTFRHFDIDSTLKLMNRVDVNYLCIKDFHLPFNSTDGQIAGFKEKLAAAGVVGYGVGPIYMKTKEEVDSAFEYAERVGVDLIVGVPNHELLPYISEKVDEYDFRYAIHIHGPDIELYPNAKDVIGHVKDLDPRLGICLDIGHDARDGFDPVEDMKLYRDRIFDIHIKDVTAASKEGTTCEMGRGIIDIPAFVKALREVGYSGACSLEFEKDMRDPLAGIAESIGYFKGVADATK